MAPSRPRAAKKAAATRSPSPRSSTPSDAPAAVAQPAAGWQLGMVAPSDQYAPVGPDGQPDTKKITEKAPKGMGVQLAIKGAPVTRAVLVGLGKLDANDPGPAQITRG